MLPAIAAKQCIKLDILVTSLFHYSPEKHSQERHETIEKYTIQVIELCIKKCI